MEIDSQLRKVVVVIKCAAAASKYIREYVITDNGVVIIGARQTLYTQLTSGLPRRIGQMPHELAPEPKAN